MIAGNDELDPAGRARERFEDAYDALAAANERDAAVNRSATDFATLSENHAAMQALRSESFAAKRGVVSRLDYPVPEHVEQPLGHQDTSAFGRAAAIFSALVILGAGVAFWLAFGGDPPVSAELVAEELIEDGNRCVLELTVVVTNQSEFDQRLTGLDTVINRRLIVSRPLADDPPLIAAGTTQTLALAVTVPATDDCAAQAVTRSDVELAFDAPDSGSSRTLRIDVDE